MLYVCVRGVMDGMLSVCIVTHGVVGACVWEVYPIFRNTITANFTSFFCQNNLRNFSITNIRRGVKFKVIFGDKNVVLYSAVYGKCFVMQMLYICVLCASCGSSQCYILPDLQFINACWGCNRGLYGRV